MSIMLDHKIYTQIIPVFINRAQYSSCFSLSIVSAATASHFATHIQLQLLLVLFLTSFILEFGNHTLVLDWPMLLSGLDYPMGIRYTHVQLGAHSRAK